MLLDIEYVTRLKVSGSRQEIVAASKSIDYCWFGFDSAKSVGLIQRLDVYRHLDMSIGCKIQRYS